MTNKSLTAAENIARRIGQRKAQDNARREGILDHYTGKITPAAKKQEPKLGTIVKHYTIGGKR